MSMPDDQRSRPLAIAEIPKPPVKSRCKRCYAICDPTPGIVSPSGVEHLSQGGDEVTQLDMTTQKLTRLQEDVLDIVKTHGPVTVKDVCYHWLLDEASARRTLSQLEAKGLIGRDYTSRDYHPSRFGYV